MLEEGEIPGATTANNELYNKKKEQMKRILKKGLNMLKHLKILILIKSDSKFKMIYSSIIQSRIND